MYVTYATIPHIKMAQMYYKRTYDWPQSKVDIAIHRDSTRGLLSLHAYVQRRDDRPMCLEVTRAAPEESHV